MRRQLVWADEFLEMKHLFVSGATPFIILKTLTR